MHVIKEIMKKKHKRNNYSIERKTARNRRKVAQSIPKKRIYILRTNAPAIIDNKKGKWLINSYHVTRN